MGRIIGGVEIDRDPPGVPAAAALLPLDDTHRQLLPHGIELLAPHVVFKPRDRRLRGKRVARDRVPPEQ